MPKGRRKLLGEHKPPSQWGDVLDFNDPNLDMLYRRGGVNAGEALADVHIFYGDHHAECPMGHLGVHGVILTHVRLAAGGVRTLGHHSFHVGHGEGDNSESRA